MSEQRKTILEPESCILILFALVILFGMSLVYTQEPVVVSTEEVDYLSLNYSGGSYHVVIEVGGELRTLSFDSVSLADHDALLLEHVHTKTWLFRYAPPVGSDEQYRLALCNETLERLGVLR